MANMPPRRILRSIVMDAISDREAFDDPSVEEETRETIEAHRALLLRLADDQPAMDGDTKDALALACLHARIWRESYINSWIHTGERDIILKARQDVERVDRTERALGFRYRTMADMIKSRGKSISLDQIRRA